MNIATIIPSTMLNPLRQGISNDYSFSIPYTYTFSKTISISFSPKWTTSYSSQATNPNLYIDQLSIYIGDSNTNNNNYTITIPDNISNYTQQLNVRIIVNGLVGNKNEIYKRAYTLNVTFDLLNKLIKFTPLSMDNNDNQLDNLFTVPILLNVNSTINL